MPDLTKISLGSKNRKLGANTTSVSFPPGCGCAKDIPCAKLCYMNKKVYKVLWPVIKAYERNWIIYKTDRNVFWDQLEDRIKRKQNLKYFRWFVAGDIPDIDFLCRMADLADKFPNIKFCSHTKKYELIAEMQQTWLDGTLPDNLFIRLSAWPGWTPPVKVEGFPTTFMQDGTVETDAFNCPGYCPSCGYKCWGKEDVQIHKH